SGCAKTVVAPMATLALSTVRREICLSVIVILQSAPASDGRVGGEVYTGHRARGQWGNQNCKIRAPALALAGLEQPQFSQDGDELGAFLCEIGLKRGADLKHRRPAQA